MANFALKDLFTPRYLCSAAMYLLLLADGFIGAEIGPTITNLSERLNVFVPKEINVKRLKVSSFCSGMKEMYHLHSLLGILDT